MAPTVAAQGQWFFASVLLGGLLALVYHFLRTLRRRFPEGALWADLLLLCCFAWTLAYLALAVCGGVFQLPQVAGLLIGAWAYKLTGFPLLQRLFAGFWGLIGKIWKAVGRLCKKIWKKLKKIAKFLFSTWKKWVTINGKGKTHLGGKKAIYGSDSRSNH